MTQLPSPPRSPEVWRLGRGGGGRGTRLRVFVRPCGDGGSDQDELVVVLFVREGEGPVWSMHLCACRFQRYVPGSKRDFAIEERGGRVEGRLVGEGVMEGRRRESLGPRKEVKDDRERSLRGSEGGMRPR